MAHARLVSTLALLALLVVTPLAAASRVLVFGAEGNRLNAYDPSVGPPAAKQTVRPSHDDDPMNGLDINAQVCFFPDGSRRFVAGEDTNQPDPPPGWGIFQLFGSEIGSLSLAQIGKLTPTYQPITDPATSVPDNYGCGFLSDGRLVTSDIGNNLPGFEGNGQLIVWFPPFDSFSVRYCKIDLNIATAGGIYVDSQDNVYAASNRPDTVPPVVSLAGIYRYSPPFPTSDDAGGGCGQIDNTGAPLADTMNKQLFIPGDAHVTTPSAIVRSALGTFYVSSVFTGVIAEYDAAGMFIRRVLEPPPGEQLPYSTGTPFGLGIDSSGTLYYADLGVGIGPPPGPVDGEGSEFRLRFVDDVPQAPEMTDDGLAFPDGIGVLEMHNLTPTRVRLKARTAPGTQNGSLRVQGVLRAPPALSADDPIIVHVKDALGPARSHTFTTCINKSGRIRCSDRTSDGQFRVSFNPVRPDPGAFRFRLSFSRYALDGPFAGPVEVTIVHDANVMRLGAISSCAQMGAAFVCREP